MKSWKDQYKPEVQKLITEVEQQIQPKLNEIDDQVT